ncbi:fibroblast growth factor 1-like [Aethina tumida]|uniref:fibroblast growth factor 1-like n=1 Tax=Aethina tumida TaxID=116153 RepID=UPI002147EB59|nr:fibroblast growth factor 1-like [Aethina tumida]
MQLYSKTEYHLAVYPDGRVFGTKDDTDLHTFLELMPGGGTSLVKIKGLLSNMYVGMNHKGKLYAEPDPLSDNIIFIEDFQGLYTTYKSKKFEKRGWYIGIKKNGKFKRGRKTKAGQKAIKFIPRRKRFE